MSKKLNKKFNILLIILFTFLILPLNIVNAEEMSKEIVKVGWFYIEGFQEYDDNGSPFGYNYEYLKYIENGSNYEFEFVNGEVDELSEMLQDGDIDMMGGINKTSDRLKDFLFDDIGYGYNSSVIVSGLDNNYAYNDFSILNGKKIIIFNSDYHIDKFYELINEYDIECEVEVSDDTSEMLERLDNKEVDFIILDSLTNFDNHKIVGEYNYDSIHFIFNKNDVELKDGISEQIVNVNLVDKLLQYKLSEKYFFNNNAVAFSEDEYNFIDNNVVTVGLDVDGTFLAKYDEETNSYSGVDYDVMNSISEYSGLNFVYKTIPENMTKIEAINSGFCDIVPDVWVTDKSISEPEITLSTVYFNDELTVIYKKGTSIESDLNVYIPEYDDGVLDHIDEFHSGWTVLNDDEVSIEESLIKLLNSEIDAVLLSNYEASYFLESPKYDGLSTYLFDDLISNKSIAINDEDTNLISIINKSLDYLDKDLENIISNSINDNKYELSVQEEILQNSSTIFLIVLIILFILAIFLVFDNKRIRRLEREAEIAKNKAIDAEKSKSDFFARMTHDMRTPLNATINFSKFGIEESASSRDISYFRQIKNSSQYLLALMNDILDMQQMENRKLKLYKEYVDFYELSDDVYMMMKDGAEAKNIEFTYESRIPDLALDRYQIIDIIRVKQILTNVLSNAIKYTDNYGKVKWISRIVNSVSGQRLLTFDIIDNGIGMSEEFQQELYEPFSQDANSHSFVDGGVGLGMAITKNLVGLMDGRIECLSSLGNGTTFTIYLPVEFITKQKYEEMKKIKEGPSKVVLDNIRVLAVEDNAINLKILKRVLIESKMVVDVAVNGAEAVEKAKANEYDIILMDIRMPVMDGIEASKQIRRFNQSIPIIAVSANAFVDDVNKSVSAGMNAHIAKPINRNELLATINRFIVYKKGG